MVMCDFDSDDVEDDGEVIDQIEIDGPPGNHLSECAIRMGYPGIGCTCWDFAPDWD